MVLELHHTVKKFSMVILLNYNLLELSLKQMSSSKQQLLRNSYYYLFTHGRKQKAM